MVSFADIAYTTCESSACEGIANDILCCSFNIPIGKVIAWVNKDEANLTTQC